METQNETRNPWKVAFWVSTGVAILEAIIIILLILLLGTSKKTIENLQSKIDLLKSEKTDLTDKLDACNDSIYLLKEQKKSLKDSLFNCKEELVKCKGQRNFFKRQKESHKTEISELKEGVNYWKAKAEILEGQIKELPDTIYLSEVDTCTEEPDTSVNLSIQFTKTSWDKKGEEKLSTEKLFDCSAPISIIPGKGFAKDSLNYLYQYINEYFVPVELSFYSLINEKEVSLEIVQKSGEKVLVLFSEDKEYPLGAGGLPVGLDDPLIWEWHLYYLEKQIDDALRKKGNWQFWGGLGGLLISSGSLYYWANQPDAVRIYDENGVLVSEEGLARQRRNTWWEGISIAGGAASTYFIVRGFSNKRASVQIKRGELTATFNLSK